jgi:hypothetical protein
MLVIEVAHSLTNAAKNAKLSAPSWNSADSAGLKSGIGGVFLPASSSS